MVIAGHFRGVPGSGAMQPCHKLQLLGSRVGASK